MNIDSRPLISVIVPTHNRPELLNEAIQSVCNQTIKDYELIIVDDASNSIVNKSELRKQFDISNLLVKRNTISQGGAESKNIGASLANGKYIAFLDDDDKLSPTYLEQAIKLLENEPKINLVFMGVSWFGSRANDGENNYNSAMKKIFEISNPHLINKHYYLFDENLTNALLKTVPMSFQRSVTSLKSFHSIGNYDKNCLLWDCDWALRASFLVKCSLIPNGLYCQRADNQGLSSVNRALEQMYSAISFKEKFFRKIEEYNDKKPLQHSAKKILAQSWFDIAYYLKKDDKLASFKAWYKSQTYDLNLKRITFVIKLLFY